MRRRVRSQRLGAVVAGVFAFLVLVPGSAETQVTLRDFVVTGGLSAEGYQGNLPTAGATVQDSTDVASAVVSEMGARGGWVLRRGGQVRASLDFDGGVRQFTARGFELRDYAPREWVGTVDLTGFQPVTSGLLLSSFVRLRGREVEDRPPMPLFLAPSYWTLQGGAGLAIDLAPDRRINLTLAGERSDFAVPEFAPQVRLLDRSGASARIAVVVPGGPNGSVELSAGAEMSRYPEQETFVDDDPFRRDRGWNAGIEWTHQGPRIVQVGAQVRANRSNSRRPEYNSVTIQGLFSTPIPGDVILSSYAALTAKRYLEATTSARLIPGEEANNASLAHVAVTRGLARNLDGTLRLGWTRAETEIGGEYFQRVGAHFLLRYRPEL